ncbi:peptide deformylase [Phormidium sp. CLA17]|uniref:peptide deformylase n=1 Tax=Leptolyngbya sp. Cla-17 TaxID=2803751 RepID=UPI0014921D90|nr:peptide deformylase [Leptolyngbya sp. Cla-17]MBM0743477.1 peptide deformylase [Leptolyngbya sp. Cla-17]
MTAEVLVEKKKLAKPPLEIHQLGDRVLRVPAKRIAKVDAEIKQLIREMLQTMYSADGIGLAAPQVGVNKQLVVVDCDPDDAAKPPLILINPTVTKASQEIVLNQEGCLSIPNVYLDVKRPTEIEVSYKDENGRPQRLAATGLLGCCIQHEIDHLNGVLFVDRVENALELNQELMKHGFSGKAVKPVS